MLQKEIESNAGNFIILSCFAFNLDFAANVAIFLYKSALFMNPAIADLATKPSIFILLATISLVNLL